MFFADKILRYVTGVIRLNNELPNDGYIAGIPKVVAKNFDLVQSAAGTPGAVTSFHSFTIPQKTMKIGDLVTVYHAGFYNVNDNNKSIEFYVGGNGIEITGLIDIDDLGWVLTHTFGVASLTALRHGVNLSAGLAQIDSVPNVAGGFGGRMISRGGTNTVANLDSNGLVIEIKGQGTALGDVTKAISVISLTRFG